MTPANGGWRMAKISRLVAPVLALFATLPALGRDLPASLDEWLAWTLTEKRVERHLALRHIGIAATRRDDRHFISAVLDGSPAFAAGLRRGEELLSVDGAPYQPIRSFNPTVSDAAPRSRFQLRIASGGSERDVSIVPVFANLFDSYRGAVAASARQFSMGNKVVGYVRLWGISRNANDLVSLRKVVAELGNTSSLMLDLRNAAGHLAAEHLALFMPENAAALAGGEPATAFSPEEGDGAQLLHPHPGLFPFAPGDYYSNPIAVIIDQTTAGPAELFARRLAALERVTSVGGAAAGGLEPELPVAWPPASDLTGDPQFEAALALLAGLL